jgi:hypothetical protein
MSYRLGAPLAFVAVGAAVRLAGADPAALKRVAGKVEMTHSICRGGVAVTQEDYERLPPPQPLGGKEFLVVAGAQIRATRTAARFVTRADGTFVTRLPPGQWCFFEASRTPSEPRRGPGEPVVPKAARPGQHVDADCLESERRRCDLVLAVKSDVSRARITFTERCPQSWAQPCYRGPMPP